MVLPNVLIIFLSSYSIDSDCCSARKTNWDCCTSSQKCGVNRGDCDSDNDCKRGLKCGKDNCPAGFPTKSYDCCYKPSKGELCYQKYSFDTLLV